MESQTRLKQFSLAVSHELLRFPFAYNTLASLVLLAVVVAGFYWQERYQSSAAVRVELNSIAAQSNEDERLAEMTPVELAEYQAAINFSKERLLALLGSTDFRRDVHRAYSAARAEDKVDDGGGATEYGIDEEPLLGALAVDSAEQGKLIRFYYQAHSPASAERILGFILEALLQRVKPAEKLALIAAQVEEFSNNEERLSAAITALEEELISLARTVDDTDDAVRKERTRSVRVAMEDAQVAINASNARIDIISQQLATEQKLLRARHDAAALQNQEAKLLAAIEEASANIAVDAAPTFLQQKLERVRAELRELKRDPAVFADQTEQPLYGQLREKLTLERVEKKAIESRYESLRALLRKQSRGVSQDKSQNTELFKREQALALRKQELADIRASKQASLNRQLRIQTNQAVYVLSQPPSRPEKYLGLGLVEFLLIGPLLAGALPWALGSLIVLLDSKIRSSGQLQRALGSAVPLVAVIPYYSSTASGWGVRKTLLGLVMWGAMVACVYSAPGVIAFTT